MTLSSVELPSNHIRYGELKEQQKNNKRTTMQQSAPIEVGITVNDIQTMTAFYQQVFNCTEDHRADIPASLSSSLGIAKRGYLCVWLTTPNNERIKLMAPPAPPKPEPDDDFFTTRCGFAYLTFYCRDLRLSLIHI